MAAEVDIIVPQHNHSDLTTNLLKSLRTCTLDYRVILVDNGSDQEEFHRSLDALPANHEIVELPANLGYTKAINAGLRVSDAPHVVFQDNDTEVPAGCFETLRGHLDAHKTLGGVGPVMSDGESMQSVRYIGGFAGKPEVLFTNLLSTFCAMFPRQVIETVGPLDEDFYAYGVDDDYCYRIADCGWRVGVALDVLVTHHQHQTSWGLIGEQGIISEGDEALRRLAEKHGSR